VDMSLHELVRTAIEQHASSANLPVALLLGLLAIFLNTRLLNLCLPDLRAERKLKAWRLRVAGATAAMAALTLLIAWGGKQAQTRQTANAGAMTPAVVAAFEDPSLTFLIYRTATDSVELHNLNSADPAVAGPVFLPMSLVRDLDRALAGHPLRFRLGDRVYLAPDPSPLEQRLQEVLEGRYARPARLRFGFALAVAAAGFAFALRRAATHPGNRSIPFFPASFAALVIATCLLCPQMLDAEARSATACEPVAAALARAYTRPQVASITELRGAGPDGRRLIVKVGGIPQTLLGRLGTVIVIADLREPLIRDLDAAAAEFGYAPLNSLSAPPR